MRVLVEQSRAVVGEFLRRSQAVDGSDHGASVFALMGGVDRVDWHLEPEASVVLVGTQDLLLSRALNRGYGAGRARWPAEYGLLHHDCLWVMDEVQLMDVGLATSAQLQAFRREDAEQRYALRPSHTWWMSATLQPEWLETPESAGWLPALRHDGLRISAGQHKGQLWEVKKPLELRSVPLAADQDCSISRSSLGRSIRASRHSTPGA